MQAGALPIMHSLRPPRALIFNLILHPHGFSIGVQGAYEEMVCWPEDKAQGRKSRESSWKCFFNRFFQHSCIHWTETRMMRLNAKSQLCLRWGRKSLGAPGSLSLNNTLFQCIPSILIFSRFKGRTSQPGHWCSGCPLGPRTCNTRQGSNDAWNFRSTKWGFLLGESFFGRQLFPQGFSQRPISKAWWNSKWVT